VIIAHAINGRHVHRRCKPKATKGTRCTRTATDAQYNFHATTGHNTFTFRAPNLHPARYTTTITATAATAESSRPIKLTSTIRPPTHAKHR
jgi:hypothetical protein